MSIDSDLWNPIRKSKSDIWHPEVKPVKWRAKKPKVNERILLNIQIKALQVWLLWLRRMSDVLGQNAETMHNIFQR